VNGPSKVLLPGNGGEIVTMIVDLIVKPQSQQEFDDSKPTDATALHLGNSAYYDSFQKEVVWRKNGVGYSLDFATGGSAVDQTKATGLLTPLAAKIMTKI
jgi:hypothetical protein